MTITSISALEALHNHKLDKRKSSRYPREGDTRIENGLIFPYISPSFQIPKGGTVFTIGSCFAREIEEEITGVRLPTTETVFPELVVNGRRNSVLNEFNPACMAQRINWAIDGQDTREFSTSLVGIPGFSRDLLLAKGNSLKIDQLLKVRHKIDGIYGSLVQSDVLILTLGMTMVWQDLDTKHYLNRMPDIRSIREKPNRYQHIYLDTSTIVELLGQAIDKTKNTKVLLTVSPVPLQSTFLREDCTISNSLSKATLRCAAAELVKIFPKSVDYYPSYEIVSSGGLSSFNEDNVHLKKEVVKVIMKHMINHYMDEVP